MYIMMCEIYKHSESRRNFEKYMFEDRKILLSAHPIEAVKTLDDAHEWMFREPEKIVEYLNLVTEDTWSLDTFDRNETHATIWNKDETIERLYVARRLD